MEVETPKWLPGDRPAELQRAIETKIGKVHAFARRQLKIVRLRSDLTDPQIQNSKKVTLFVQLIEKKRFDPKITTKRRRLPRTFN